jgi:hypothetical protein
MKKVSLIILTLLICVAAMAQKETEKKKFKFKKPNLNIREKLGDLAGNAMTGKTDDLALTAPVITLITGIYSPETKTSETKYFPDNVVEGDQMISITFMKNSGMGMLQIKGDVNYIDEPMEYVGLGSYMHIFEKPVDGPRSINVTTETGDKAAYTLFPVPTIEIIEVNGDATFPIVDLTEDMRLKVTHSPKAEGTVVKVGIIANIAGARAINYFAEFKATDKEIIIPRESFSNLEYSGKLNTGQLDKGLTYLVVTREKVMEESEIDVKNKTGAATGVKFKMQSYGSKQILVKGKQENGVITEVKFSGRFKDKLSYSIKKPNARRGLPLSRASKFGLASLSLNGKTYKKEVVKGTNNFYSGGTSYTRTWTRTTTYKFPQLPDAYWENVMGIFYKKLQTMMNEHFSVEFEDVDKVTGSPHYAKLFEGTEYNTSEGISKSYKNTKLMSPTSFSQAWLNRSSSQSTETPANMLMKDLGMDGLVSFNINFDIGANRDDKIVLLPQISFSIRGVDETKDYKEGTYAEGFITYKEGIPFSTEKLENDPNYLAEILSCDRIIDNLRFMLITLQQKEVELGFEKIWAIGEE